MQVRTEAVVLRVVRCAGAALVVDTLTREMGRVAFVCRPSRSSRARVRPQLFQPLSIVEAVYDHRPRAALQRLAEARLAAPYATIHASPHKLGAVLFLSEFLAYATRDEQPGGGLYDYVAQSLRWLDAAPGGTANFHLVFMMRVSRFLGLFPNLDGYREGDVFDLREGVFARSEPTHPDFIAPADAAHIITLMRVNYQSMHLIRISREERGRILTAILYYYRLHIAAFPQLRSPDVLSGLYG